MRYGPCKTEASQEARELHQRDTVLPGRTGDRESLCPVSSWFASLPITLRRSEQSMAIHSSPYTQEARFRQGGAHRGPSGFWAGGDPRLPQARLTGQPGTRRPPGHSSCFTRGRCGIPFENPEGFSVAQPHPHDLPAIWPSSGPSSPLQLSFPICEREAMLHPQSRVRGSRVGALPGA